MKNISLLPPEIKAEQRSRQQLRLALLCSGVVVLVFLCIYGGLIFLTYQEKMEASRLQEQITEVQKKAIPYQKYEVLKADVDTLEKINNAAVGGIPNWYYLFAEVGLEVPEGVWLTGCTASYNKPEKKQAQEGTENDQAESTPVTYQGELTIRGMALDHKDVAAFVKNLHAIQGLDNIRCQFSSEQELAGQKAYEFEIKASLPVQKGGE